MKDSSLVIGFGATLLVIYVIDRLLQARNNADLLPLPPGPKGLPLVGNLRDLPKRGTFAARHWLEFKDAYGPLSSITVLGKTMVLINDAQLALDLLEKRSTYSSRLGLQFAGEMVGWNNSTPGLSYHDRQLRFHRKSFARIIGSKKTASQYNELQEAEVGHFLLHVLDDPSNLEDHIKKEAGTAILKIVYGYNAEQTTRDPLIDKIQKAMDDLSRAAVPGAYLVDVFPMLRHVPEWFPGAGWKKVAKQFNAELTDSVEKPYKFVEHQLAEGKENMSYVSHLIKNSGNTPEEIHSNKWSAVSLFSGGADTTVSSICAFFLAMTVCPDVQAKAQAEIDRVVGSERLPNIDDRENLPYIDAIVKESLRWHTIIPMGLPHCCPDDTTFEGYRIPKNALLMANVWWFTHDPAVYKDPMEFRPERHMEGQGREPEIDPRKFVFGFGRRICPGRILAESSLFLNFAQSLAVFYISKRVVDGVIVEPEVESLPGAVSHLAHFETSIKPRSPHHEKLIRSIEQKFPWQPSDGKLLERMD